MAVSKAYRLSVDYTAATQIEVTSSPTNSKPAFVPMVQFYSGGTPFDVAITSPLGTKAIAASVAVNPATSSSWAITAAQLPATLGIKSPAASLSVTPAGLEYETVAASATDQVLGTSGAAGDYLSHIVIQPATTGAGTVTVKDDTTVIFTFTTGTLADLSPKTVPLGLFSVNGAWKVTTGANVAVLGIGDFT